MYHLKTLPGDFGLSGPVRYKRFDPSQSLDVIYNIFKRTIGPSVKAMNGGVWPEEKEKAFFANGIYDNGMAVLIHNEKSIGCFCITTTNLTFINEENVGPNAQDGAGTLAGDATYMAVVLQRVYIDIAYQGKGIGKAIIALALQRAHEERLPLELTVLANNEFAIRAYERQGFASYATVESGRVQRRHMRHRDTQQYIRLPVAADQAWCSTRM